MSWCVCWVLQLSTESSIKNAYFKSSRGAHFWITLIKSFCLKIDFLVCLHRLAPGKNGFQKTKMLCSIDSNWSHWCARMRRPSVGKNVKKKMAKKDQKIWKMARNVPKSDPAHSCASMRPCAINRALNYGLLNIFVAHRRSLQHPFKRDFLIWSMVILLNKLPFCRKLNKKPQHLQPVV